MTITSLDFALFAALVLAVYYLLPRRPQNVLLLVASYLFYGTWSWDYAAVLAVLTGLDFVAAWGLARPAWPRQRRRALLWAVIALNLAALGWFKYAGFFVGDLATTLDDWGIHAGAGGLDTVLPVGMSFYVLGAISYLVDVYRRQVPPARDPVAFALYMAYFPKLLSGPIERARTFLPRLAAPRRVDNETLARSLTLIMTGLVRKMVIADPLNTMLPPDVFAYPARFGPLELITWLLVYAFALYNDFAGYTSIVRGVSGLFGIELASNFNVPYFARSFTEFWNRWHSTLSLWLRDYIYFPTSRALLRRNPSRANVPNLILPPMLTMLASGVWHGTGWHMLLWGALHGGYLVGERLLSFGRPVVPSAQRPRWRQVMAAGLVCGLVVLAWVPFRMEIGTALDYWRALFDWSNLQRPSYRPWFLLLPGLWIDYMHYRAADEWVFLRWPRLVQAALLALAILALLLVTRADSGAPFVYQGF